MKFYKINENQRSDIQSSSIRSSGFSADKFYIDNDSEGQRFSNKKDLIEAVLMNTSVIFEKNKLTVVAVNGADKEKLKIIETMQDYQEVNNDSHLIYIVPNVGSFLLAKDQIQPEPKKPMLNLYGNNHKKRVVAEQKTNSVTAQPSKTATAEATVSQSSFGSLSFFSHCLPGLQASILRLFQKQQAVRLPTEEGILDDLPPLQLDGMSDEEDVFDKKEFDEERAILEPRKRSFSN